MYLTWAAFYEGSTDALYFDILLPRVLEEILRHKGIRPYQVPATPSVHLGLRSRDVQAVAEEICREQETFHLLFVHADTGGRSLAEGIRTRREAFAEKARELCGWSIERTALVSPRHETEAWALADGQAVCRALGFHGSPDELELPATAEAAEHLIDAKLKLNEVARNVSARAYRNGAAKLLPIIAQEQDLRVLRGCPSFRDFEDSLTVSLSSLGCF